MRLSTAYLDVLRGTVAFLLLSVVDLCTAGRVPYAPQRLALWIDGREIEKLTGIPIDIYIIRDGSVVPYLKDAQITQQLPVLPPDVTRVDLTWRAEDDVYTYKFSELRSLDPHILYNPLISINIKGTIPKTPTGFHLSFPCTLNETGIASIYIALQLHNSRGHAVPGSPLAFSLRKRCEAAGKERVCRCKNGGKCNQFDKCDCKHGHYGTKCELVTCRNPCQYGGTCMERDLCHCPHGYYGDYCQHKNGVCEIPCINGGICTSFNVCSCTEGYTGQFCQKSICRRWCGVHGRCVEGSLCKCHRGWHGRLCNKTINRLSDDEDTKNNSANIKRRKRKLKQINN